MLHLSHASSILVALGANRGGGGEDGVVRPKRCSARTPPQQSPTYTQWHYSNQGLSSCELPFLSLFFFFFFFFFFLRGVSFVFHLGGVESLAPGLGCRGAAARATRARPPAHSAKEVNTTPMAVATARPC